MSRIMSLSSLGGVVELGRASGIRATTKMRGTGLPPVSTQWFEGAGDGAKYRGARVLPRVIDLTIKIEAGTRDEVRERLSSIGRIFAPGAGDVRLAVDLDGDPWFVDVRRTGGGDFDWDADTDGGSYLKTTLTLQAGDPYWTREDEDQRVIKPGGLGDGLLSGGSLSEMNVSTTTSLGATELPNSGDVDAFPRWVVRAPFTSFTLTSAKGEELVWGTGGNGVAGASKATGFIEIDTELGTVVDETGANRYDGLGPVPKFWPVPPGSQTASILVTGASEGSTQVEVVWRPRRWVLF